MSELSRDDIAEVLGRVGDAIAAEIVATGIGKDELRAARDRVVRDRKSRTPGPPLKPGAFAQVVDISSDRMGCGARRAPTSNRRELRAPRRSSPQPSEGIRIRPSPPSRLGRNDEA